MPFLVFSVPVGWVLVTSMGHPEPEPEFYLPLSGSSRERRGIGSAALQVSNVLIA